MIFYYAPQRKAVQHFATLLGFDMRRAHSVQSVHDLRGHEGGLLIDVRTHPHSIPQCLWEAARMQGVEIVEWDDSNARAHAARIQGERR